MTQPSAETVLTGVGANTALGGNAVQTAAFLRTGMSALNAWPHFGLTFEEGDELVTAATTPDLGDRPWIDKAIELLESPLAEALEQAELDVAPAGAPGGPSDLGIFVALPGPGRPKVDQPQVAAFAEELEEFFAEVFPSFDLNLVHLDHAGGLTALAQATAALGQGTYRTCLVCGTDSLLDSAYLHELFAARRLKTPNSASGLIPGEAAAALVLERRAEATKRGAPMLGRIDAVALEKEAAAIDPQAPIEGQALSRAIRSVLQTTAAERITRVIVDHSGERWRSFEGAMVETRCLGGLPHGWQLWHPADSVGDTGAASGVLAMVIAVRAMARNYAGDGALLVTSSSYSGERAAATLSPIEKA